jgi:hypothetical protein
MVFSLKAAFASSASRVRSAERRSVSTCSSRNVTVSSTGRSITLEMTRTPPVETLGLLTENDS